MNESIDNHVSPAAEHNIRGVKINDKDLFYSPQKIKHIAVAGK